MGNPDSIRFVPGIVVLLSAAALASHPPPDALTEQSVSQWSAQAASASAAVFDDATRVQVNAWSIRLETDAPFDCRMWAPAARDADWDLTPVARIQFWVYAINTNLSFQNQSPWVAVGSSTGQWEYRPSYDLLNDARNTWLHIDIPLAGDSFWQRTQVGSPSLTDIDFIEIHADTWGAGFTLWVDGLTFDETPALPDGLMALAGDNRVALAWRPYVAGTSFGYFAVYRDTSAFSSVAGMTPIATLSSAATTTFIDATAANGTGYHYAVTAVSAGGQEETDVASVGPRTPRSETDLQVMYIGRTPRYPRYDPSYTVHTITEPSGYGPYVFTSATGLGSGQTAGTQRFPNAGDVVTYTAHVRNRGTTPVAGPVGVTWRYDGAVVGASTIAGPLVPGATGTSSIMRVWDGQPHEVGFSIDAPDDRPTNNTLMIDSNAVGFLSFVDQTYIEDFRERTPQYPQAATDDFADWLHRHMAEMNRLFTETGSVKRIRFDRLEVLDDYAVDPSVTRIDYAIFPFRYRAGDGDLRTAGYYRANVDIDYGLLHEKGHQLGLIDIYRLDLPGARNHVSGRGYLAVPGLMHGVSDFLSAHSALAMNHWADLAHGYFGQYMYAMPDAVRVRFVGIDGAPLADATVKLYQKVEVPGQGELIPNQVKAQGVTDANGVWALPNVPIDPNLVPTTFAGDTLRANPFGYVAVIGTNGLLHFRVEKDGAVDYAWLEITEVNNAYWQGQTVVATFERQVAVGGPVQVVPPPDMTEFNAADWVAWAAGSSPNGTFVVDDATPGLHPVGGASIKFVTDGGFDTAVRYPGTFTAHWDLSGANTLNVYLRTANANLAFQGGSPWIRLGDNDNNYFEYRYYVNGGPFDLLNETRDQWRSYSIPLDAPANPGTGWGRQIVGTPSMDDIRSVEIHADTWGAGFVMWIDGLSFDPQPCILGDLNADGLRNGVDVQRFVAAMMGGGGALAVCAGDFDQNGVVNSADVAPFVACVLDVGACP